MSSAQAACSLEFIRTFKSEKTKVLVDPVMGDDGHTYKNFSNELLKTIREMVKEAAVHLTLQTWPVVSFWPQSGILPETHLQEQAWSMKKI